MMRTVVERLMRKTEKVGDCIFWTGSKRSCGYGTLTVDGVNWSAHRLSYTLFIGPIPKGMLVCHQCDNPVCINPKHLFLGTDKTNAIDKVSKNRHVYGEKVVQAKLKEWQIKAIRADDRPTSKIASDFGVTPDNVLLIKKRITWKHIE